MICSVLNCLNSFVNNPDNVSFHEFPHDRDALQYWINFTGRSNFFPSFNSKICSAHFEDDAYFMNSSTLKPGAYPTICATDESQSQDVHHQNSQIMQSNGSRTDTVFSILNKNNIINREVGNCTHVSDSNKMLNIVPSHHQFPLNTLPDAKNTIILNYNRNTLETGGECYVPLQFQVPVNLFRMQVPNVRLLGQNQLTSLGLPSSNSYRQPITHVQSQISQKGPIKVVDMKKLLQHPLKDERTIASKSTTAQDHEIVKHVTHSTEKIPSKPHIHNKNKFQKESTSSSVEKVMESPMVNVPSKVAASQVLDCLKVILPVKFDLSKLVPNDKVAALIIRYLKLNDDIVTKNAIIMHLRIIVDAAKVKEKSVAFGVKHPYWKINDIALQIALEKVLPPKFAMSDVTNLVLNCLCIVLNQDVYIDGYQILRKLIRKFINEGQHCDEVPNQEINMNSQINEKRTRDKQEEKLPLKKLKLCDGNRRGSRKKKLHSKRIISHSTSATKSEEFQSNNKTILSTNNLSFTRKLVNKDVERLEMASETLKSKVTVVESSSKKSMHNTPLSNSLEKKKVRKIRVKSDDEDYEEKPNYRKKPIIHKPPELDDPETKEAIEFYFEKQQNSPKDVLSTFRGMFHLCRFLHVKTRQFNLQKLNEILALMAYENKSKRSSKLIKGQVNPKQKSTNKLKLRPVVVLRDLIDFKTEDIFLMKNKKVRRHMGYYNQRVPNCNQQYLSPKYSSEYVKKLTVESYNTYRRVIVKKLGKRVVFRLKYSILAPGSLVFVKDFRNPSLGWLKGSINKMVDSLKYVVQLSSGEMWWCAPEQLRPLPLKETQQSNSKLLPRSHRVIKPKQLFDL